MKFGMIVFTNALFAFGFLVGCAKSGPIDAQIDELDKQTKELIAIMKQHEETGTSGMTSEWVTQFVARITDSSKALHDARPEMTQAQNKRVINIRTEYMAAWADFMTIADKMRMSKELEEDMRDPERSKGAEQLLKAMPWLGTNYPPEAGPNGKTLASRRHVKRTGLRLSDDQVIEIAKSAATDEGIDLSKYDAAKCYFELTEGDKRWSVVFETTVSLPPGGHFFVFVDDITKEATVLQNPRAQAHN